MRRMVLGIAGHIGHGKDEAAKSLADYGLRVVRFSDELKEEVLLRLNHTLQALTRARVFDDYSDRNLPDELRWTYALSKDEAWWDRRLRFDLWVRKPAVIRELLQNYGTEVRRRDIPDYWCTLWQRRVAGVSTHVAATDMRFENEARYVRANGGLLVKVWRPGAPVDLTHESERFAATWEDWDQVFVNDGTLVEHHLAVRQWFRRVAAEASDITE